MPDGHNGPKPTTDEFMDFSAEDLEIERAQIALRQRRELNMVRWEGIGGKRQQLQTNRKMEKNPAFLGLVQQVAEWRGEIEVDAGGQENFLPVLDAKEPEPSPDPTTETAVGRLALARAGMDGFNSGLAGATLDNNPWAAGTEAHGIWRSNCADGISRRAEIQLAKDARKELRDGVTHIDPAAVEAAQEPAPAPADKPKRGRRSKGLTPNGPTEADVAEQTGEAKAGWSASDFTDSSDMPEPPTQVH